MNEQVTNAAGSAICGKEADRAPEEIGARKRTKNLGISKASDTTESPAEATTEEQDEFFVDALARFGIKI